MTKKNDDLRKISLELCILFFERFFQPIYFIGSIVIFLIIINLRGIVNVLYSFHFSEYALAKDYLEVIVSLPMVILILGLIFIFKFSNSISEFLKNSKPDLRGFGPADIIQQKSPSESKSSGVSADNKTPKPEEIWEFASLSSFLVDNSKRALFWFYNFESKNLSKKDFVNLFPLQEQMRDHSFQKEMIFNALLIGKLIEKNGNLFTISSKGTKFLKFIKYI